MKRLEILVVEDGRVHLKDAKEYFTKAEEKKVCKVSYAETLKEARSMLSRNNYQGVISDIFFPSGLNQRENKKVIAELVRTLERYADHHDYKYRIKFQDAMNEWIKGKTNPPCGVLVVQQAKDKMPVILNTDMHHHAYACEPINRWRPVPLVDSGTHEHPINSHKNWKSAYARIVLKIFNQEDMSISDIDAPERLDTLLKEIGARAKDPEWVEDIAERRAKVKQVMSFCDIYGI